MKNEKEIEAFKALHWAEYSELDIYRVNDSNLYFKYYGPKYNNLLKKFKAGAFKKERALDLVILYVNQCAKQYCLEHCASEKDWSSVFKLELRKTMAMEIVLEIEAEFKAGNLEEISRPDKLDKKGRAI